MLNDTAIRAAKPGEKPYKLADGGGLYLEVLPSGAKSWRLKYRFAGKEKRLVFGLYPTVTLKAVRERAFEAKRMLADGVDPGEAKQEERAQLAAMQENTFEAVARAWHKREAKRWTPAHAMRIMRDLERDIFQVMGDIPVANINTPTLLRIIKKIEERGAIDVASRAQQRITSILRYAVQHGMIEHNPGVNLRGVIVKPPTTHRIAVPVGEVGELAYKIDHYVEDHKRGKELTRLALKLTLYTFLRSTEIRGARWCEIDLEKREWLVPGIRDVVAKNGGMKSRKDHIVPLSRQAVGVLEAIKALDLGDDLVFPIQAGSKRIMSENTMNHALNKMGYKGRQTVHGLRTVASTILNKGDARHKWNKDAIERQLAHSPASDNQVRDAYNRYEFLEERTEMMQWYADHLDMLAAQAEAGGKVIEFKRQA